jgi:UDP-N-acetylmuramoyl-tripeptide--D-alanyl-D-alanine ligase
MSWFAIYLPNYPLILVYMLQNVEYQPGPYLRWFWRTDDFSQVMKRRTLQPTKAARLLLMALRLGMAMQILAGLGLFWLGLAAQTPGTWAMGAALLISYPVIWAHLVVVPLILGRWLIVAPRERQLVAASKRIFADTKAIKIAVAGSYGKTSMKELLGVVLAEGKNVAITPANKNVAISHALFAQKLKGDEDVLVIEYGEGAPGDVAKFSATTQPNIGIITGIAPAHLDQYPTLEAATQDIYSLADYLQDQQVYVNQESAAGQDHIRPSHLTYSAKGVGDWKASDVHVGLDGVRFKLAKGKQTLHIHSGLLGRHQIGPLAAVAAIADSLGLSAHHIEAGLRKTVPFEHRMQPRQLRGAWIIDDTYNGNIEGLKAGLALLSELPAKRKIYVTPGLVDQGVETENVHVQLGQAIASANPDKVVLMQNSVTGFIQRGLQAGSYQGELTLEDDPLDFYTNVEHFLAAGDLLLMQNDWTDNYK